MEIKNFESFGEGPKFYYHATYKPRLKSILKKGLVPSFKKKNWEDSEDFVYIDIDYNCAVSFCEESEEVPDDWIDNIVVIKIDSSKLDKSKIRIDPNIIGVDHSAFIYDGVIPPDAFIDVIYE
jgi:hypothetical protein